MGNALEIRDLCKNYKDFSLDHINLTLPNGCIMGLVGENGAGKSTTVRLILDMISRDGGSVRILGKDNKENGNLIREEVGVVPDEVGIPGCLTARQTGKIMAGTYRNWNKEVYEGYLDKLDIPKDKAFGKFSKGTRMKLGIAIALSHAPKLLILDEATSGLDPVVRDEIIEMFGEFTRQEDHAVLISSHIISDLEKICDYMAFLHQGRLLMCEEKDRLKERYGILRCSAEQLAKLDGAAVIGKRESAYGVEAVVKKDALPAGMETGPVDLEELFILMVKGKGKFQEGRVI